MKKNGRTDADDSEGKRKKKRKKKKSYKKGGEEDDREGGFVFFFPLCFALQCFFVLLKPLPLTQRGTRA